MAIQSGLEQAEELVFHSIKEKPGQIFYGRSDFGTDNVSAIGYDNYTGTFWCATAKSQEVTGGQKLPSGTGLKYTTNFGQTWNSIPQTC